MEENEFRNKTIEAPHPDDIAVDKFAAAMKAKLAKKREEGRGGWEDKDQCSIMSLAKLFHEHVKKEDPVDVANLAMMLYHRLGTIPALPTEAEKEAAYLAAKSGDLKDPELMNAREKLLDCSEEDHTQGHTERCKPKDVIAEAERMTKLSVKWAKETIAGVFPKIEADWDTLSEYFRQCLEEWTGEGRQQPKPETLAEIDAMLKPRIGDVSQGYTEVKMKPLDCVGVSGEVGKADTIERTAVDLDAIYDSRK